MIKKATKIDKGGAAEEAFRQYFADSGAFVLRGVPVRQEKEDITDIDLWVYNRSSAHNRWITQVDIKNKRKAKGFERAVWARGLLAVTRANEAMIVSSASKGEVKEFAKKLGVRVISSNVFSAIQKRYADVDTSRFSYEEAFAEWQEIRSDEFKHLGVQVSACLEKFGDGIDFADLNYLIDNGANLLLHHLDHERSAGFVFRALLFTASMIGVAADYLSKDFSFDDYETRKTLLTSGLIFGRLDESVVESYIGFAEKAVRDFVDPSGASSAMVRMGLKRAVSDLPINQFVEFFAKPSAGRDLLRGALELEGKAFSRSQPTMDSLGAEAKMLVLLLADYAGVERRKLGDGRANGDVTKTSDSEKVAPEANGDLLL